MKNILVTIIGLPLFFHCVQGSCNVTPDNQAEIKPSASNETALNILSSTELSNLTTTWCNEYGRSNPELKIDIGNIGDNQAITGYDIGFISDNNSNIINDETNWEMVIGRDPIVSVINAKNPMLNEIYRQGISSGKFEQLLSNPEEQNWKALIKGGTNIPVHFYTIDGDVVKKNISNFIKTEFPFPGISVATSEDLVSAIQKDIYAIGFCKLTDIMDNTTNEIVANIKLLPIDKNSNGRIDHFEKIYNNLAAFARGVWIGKYPRELCGNIYAVSPIKPTDKNMLLFLNWILTKGQQYLNLNGYANLASSEIQANINELAGTEVIATKTNEQATSHFWLFILLGVLLIASILAIVFRNIEKLKSAITDEDFNFTPAFNENSVIAPKGLYFDKTHTWAFMEKDGMVKVGIDDFMQHITGPLNRIKMKEPGEKIRKGEKILTIIQNGKQLEIYTPISGTIKEQNQKLNKDSLLLNTSPFSEGWVYLIEPKNWLREIQFLLMGENYNDWLKDEFIRLKDFFASTVSSKALAYSHIILQDGGELTDNILADFGPEVWEDFQTKFIDASK